MHTENQGCHENRIITHDCDCYYEFIIKLMRFMPKGVIECIYINIISLNPVCVEYQYHELPSVLQQRSVTY